MSIPSVVVRPWTCVWIAEGLNGIVVFDALSGLLAERSTSDASVVSDALWARYFGLIGEAESGLRLTGIGGNMLVSRPVPLESVDDDRVFVEWIHIFDRGERN